MSDDDFTDEQQRKMAAKLLMGTKRQGPKVEVRRSGNKKPEPVELRFINHLDSYDGEWLWCEVQQKASSGWIKVETFEDKKAAERAAEKYQRLGDKVSWWKKEV
ncbi:hypothetical protein [Sinorhizobium meliloti]|uniref:hypothetical protein n=1 Tax=Rhizobium meliloti TaxID=382 RepID=UPI000FDB3DFC|nr:hypothetical protein [Sinorhizobium meliloti]RVH37652.1 hypothetical protein CN211_07335 [Sinorhizobium meliloti]